MPRMRTRTKMNEDYPSEFTKEDYEYQAKIQRAMDDYALQNTIDVDIDVHYDSDTGRMGLRGGIPKDAYFNVDKPKKFTIIITDTMGREYKKSINMESFADTKYAGTRSFNIKENERGNLIYRIKFPLNSIYYRMSDKKHFYADLCGDGVNNHVDATTKLNGCSPRGMKKFRKEMGGK